MNNDDIEDIFVNHAAGILADTELGLTGPMIAKLCVAYSIDAKVQIPHSSYPFANDIPNKRIALIQNILAFPPKWKYKIIKELCDDPKLKEKQPAQAETLKLQLLRDYSHFDEKCASENLNNALVKETQHWLSVFPKSLDLYNQALSKYQHRIFTRNLLDDLRLSLETLLQRVFQNQKSLENQKSLIGKYIEDRGGSTEIVNMLVKLFDYYANYQNTYVKHDSAVVDEEVEFVVEITSCFMRHLVRLHGRNRS